MSDFRAFCRPPTGNPVELTLSPDESHHLVVVNRARKGDTVIAFDGRGLEWTCELVSDCRQGAVLKVGTRREVPALGYEITLAQALPKGPGMDAIVRKATEIGTARIVPLETERTQVHLEGERSGKKIEKWQVAALEAAKQCGNPFLPEILPIQTTVAFLQSAQAFDLRLIASLQPGAMSLKTVLTEFRAAHRRSPVKVAWLIGPEGDFSPAEYAAAASAGFQPVSLGPLVLRCETAAVYALSVLSYELQNP